MKDKQLTLEQVLDKIIKSECMSCGINLDIKNNWRIPMCEKCRLEAIEDLENYLLLKNENKDI